MTTLLSAAGRAFLYAFMATYAMYIAGILEAPNTDTALALAVAALVASIVAALGALKQFVPQFSWATILPFVPGPWVARLDIFTITLVGSLIVAVTDVLNSAPDLSTWKAIVTGVVTGALAAAFRSVVAAGTKGETPFAAKGLQP